MITVKSISTEQTYPLRHLVLWPHKSSEAECIIDIDNRKDAIHLGAFENEQLLGIGSLFEMKTDKLDAPFQYRLRAMATHPDHRGSGAGKAIVQHSLNLLKKKQVDLLWCDARQVALGFYSRLGFETIDEWYEVPHVGLHKLMYKKLH